MIWKISKGFQEEAERALLARRDGEAVLRSELKAKEFHAILSDFYDFFRLFR